VVYNHTLMSCHCRPLSLVVLALTTLLVVLVDTIPAWAQQPVSPTRPAAAADDLPAVIEPITTQTLPGVERWWAPYLRYGGIALAGLGTVALGAGAYYGNSAASQRRAIDKNTQLSQAESARRQSRSNERASRANLFYTLGGGLMLVGGGALTFDFFSAPAAPVTAVSHTRARAKPGEVTVVLVDHLTFVIEGQVVDGGTGEAVGTAQVRIGDASSPIAVDRKTGHFKSWPLEIGEGIIKVVAEAPGYRSQEMVLPRGAVGEVKTVLIKVDSLGEAALGVIRGSVRDGLSGVVIQAKVFIPSLERTLESDAEGSFEVKVQPGEYDVLISSPGYSTQVKRLKVGVGAAVILNIDLLPRDD